MSSPPSPAPTRDNPAKTPRPRLRGLTYLRSHTQSSSASATPSNTPAAPERSRPNYFSRSVSSPPESIHHTPHIVNNTILPSVRNTEQVDQSTYLDRLELALRPLPTPSNCESIFRDMARDRSGSVPNGANDFNGVRSHSNPSSSSLIGHPQDQMPTIKLIPHQDPRSNRPSLAFPATSRTLPHEDCVIRVGRYSERDMNPNPPPNTPSSAPVGFKSKVVSRRHCEFWCSHGQWYIKDMKSSSGTFLNHIRLSQPNVESKPFPVHDGDVVQLGIDFRGGEEMIFRCVKIRVECNRAWQKTLNSYNVQTHKRLRDLGRTGPKKDSDTASTHSSECSICLMSVAPCQSLFVAPCSHVWHYKCIRPIINRPNSYPQFICPNCRAVTDLEADVDDPVDDGWEDENGVESSPDTTSPMAANGLSIPEQDELAIDGGNDLAYTTSNLTIRNGTTLTPQLARASDPTNSLTSSSDLRVRRGARRTSPPFTPAKENLNPEAPSVPVQYLRPITPTQPLLGDQGLNESSLRTPTMTDHFAHDGPMTPTNNAGPFVFDGSAGRIIRRTDVDGMPETAITP